MRRAERFDGQREIAIGLGSYAAYLIVRRMVWNERGRRRAAANARRVVAFEQAVGIAVEPAVQRVALRFPYVVRVLNVGYAAGNVALSVGWLMLLYRRHDPSFVRERRAAVISFAGALPFFAALPTAPPRTLDGFVDTLAGTKLALDHPLLVRFYNPIAAMPSHHVAFAWVTGCGLAVRATRRRGKLVWYAYPGLVALTVIATANHFVADVASGAALGALSRRLTR
jgi:PAP2 superfamily